MKRSISIHCLSLVDATAGKQPAPTADDPADTCFTGGHAKLGINSQHPLPGAVSALHHVSTLSAPPELPHPRRRAPLQHLILSDHWMHT